MFAPESLLDGSGRRIFWTWLLDGRVRQREELGVMTAPRVLSLDGARQLLIAPPAELERLHGASGRPRSRGAGAGYEDQRRRDRDPAHRHRPAADRPVLRARAGIPGRAGWRRRRHARADGRDRGRARQTSRPAFIAWAEAPVWLRFITFCIMFPTAEQSDMTTAVRPGPRAPDAVIEEVLVAAG